jgi:hypothetical protein
MALNTINGTHSYTCFCIVCFALYYHDFFVSSFNLQPQHTQHIHQNSDTLIASYVIPLGAPLPIFVYLFSIAQLLLLLFINISQSFLLPITMLIKSHHHNRSYHLYAYCGSGDWIGNSWRTQRNIDDICMAYKIVMCLCYYKPI